MTANFKERFSLDFLDPSTGSKSSEAQLPVGMESVLNAYGNQILANIKAAPNQTSDLFGLARMSSARIENILPVVQYLAGKGLLERVIEDPLGNDTYRATAAGATQAK